MSRLRNTGQPRPSVDPGLSRRLSELIEAGIGGGTFLDPSCMSQVDADPPTSSDRFTRTAAATLVVTRDLVNRALSRDIRSDMVPPAPKSPTAAMACGAIVGALFRQLVGTGRIDDVMADGMAALQLEANRSGMAGWISHLGNSEFQELRVEVERQAEGLRQRWPALEPSWMPRTGAVIRASLAGGEIELVGRVDLVIGRPPVDEASVALVQVTSGVRRAEHRTDLHYLALVEALRSAAPPFVVATYYTRTGELHAETVTEEMLVGAARRTADAINALRVPEVALHRGPGPAVEYGDRGMWPGRDADAPR